MRNRINRVAIASSNSYSLSKKAHINMLKENHESNAALFMSIAGKELDELTQFELRVQRQIAKYREEKAS